MPPLTPPLPTLYELRLRAGFATQRDLAAQLGVCLRTYALYEQGQQDPPPKRVRTLARLLRVREALVWAVLHDRRVS